MTVAVGGSPVNVQVAVIVHFPDEILDLEKNIVKKLPGMMRKIAMEGKSFWKAEAGRKLKSSRKAYQDGIDFKVIDNTSFYLLLEGFIPYSVEFGNKGFDMKPGFLKAGLPWPPTKRKFPRAVAETLAAKSTITRYRIIPLNVNRYINMQKPKVFRTVHDGQPGKMWNHPGWKGVRLSDAVVKEMVNNIIPKYTKELLGELFGDIK